MKHLRWTQALGCIIAVSALARPLSAQFGYFGQNKIQYRKFDWRVLRGEHVDLYYYPEEEELGRVALAYAEESYDALERRFNHAVTRRIPAHHPSRAGARLSAEPRRADIRALPAIPAGGDAAVVDGGARRILFGGGGQPRRNGAARHDDHGQPADTAAADVCLRRAGLSRRRQHPPLSRRPLRRMAHSGVVQRHLEVQQLRCRDRRRVRADNRAAVGGVAVLDAAALLSRRRHAAAARDHGAQTHRAGDQADRLSAAG